MLHPIPKDGAKLRVARVGDEPIEVVVVDGPFE
jgi:hypothetical protein